MTSLKRKIFQIMRFNIYIYNPKYAKLIDLNTILCICEHVTLQKQDLSKVSRGFQESNADPLVPGSKPSLIGAFLHTVCGILLQSLSSTHVSL